VNIWTEEELNIGVWRNVHNEELHNEVESAFIMQGGEECKQDFGWTNRRTDTTTKI
jgi:hypothetical protein